MLCYRFMMSQRISSSSSYLKLYDGEIIPLLLRKPAATSSLYYSTLQCTASASSKSASATVSLRRQHQESDFIRFTRHLFHTSSLQLKKDDPDAVAQQPTTTGNEKPVVHPAIDPETEKLGLFARFKKMYKEYWYVLLPVHVVTSACWLGGFYYVSVR